MNKLLGIAAAAMLAVAQPVQAEEARYPFLAGIGVQPCKSILVEMTKDEWMIRRYDLAAWAQGFVSAQNILIGQERGVVLDAYQIDADQLYLHTFDFCAAHDTERIISGVINYTKTLPQHRL